MDAILPVLLVAIALEIGDRTQALAALLGARYRSPAAVITGIAVAALLLSAGSAWLGLEAADMASHRALRLLLGIALFFGGTGGFFPVKAPEPIDGWRLGAFVSSFGAFLILAALDKMMFVTLAFSAVTNDPIATAIAAGLGTTIANVPAVVTGRMIVPRFLRPALGGLLCVIGVGIGVSALGLL